MLAHVFGSPITLAIIQRRDLLRDQAHHEDDDGCGEEKRAHVREPAQGQKGIEIVADSGREEGQADGKEEFQRRVERGDLEHDQQESHPVSQRTDVAGPGALAGVDRDIADRVAGAEEGHGDGRRVREAVRQKIEKALEALRTDRAEAGGEVHDLVTGDQGREPIVEAVGKRPADAGLGPVAARADDHVVTFVERGEDTRDVGRGVLSVGVHEHEDLTGRRACPGLDGGAVAQAVGVRDDPGAVSERDVGGPVGGTVVEKDQLGSGQGGSESRQQPLE